MEKVLGFLLAVFASGLLLWMFVYQFFGNGLGPADTWLLSNFPLPIGWGLIGVFVVGVIGMFAYPND